MNIKPVEKSPLIRWVIFYSLIMLLLVTWQTSVADAVQSYTITGGEKLKVKKCSPKDTDFALFNVTVDRSNLTWEAEDDEGNNYTGTYQDISRRGSLLEFDQTSLATLKEVIKSWAEVLVGKSVDLTDFTYLFKSKVTRNLTRLRLKGKAHMIGHSDGQSWKIVYKVRAVSP